MSKWSLLEVGVLYEACLSFVIMIVCEREREIYGILKEKGYESQSMKGWEDYYAVLYIVLS